MAPVSKGPISKGIYGAWHVYHTRSFEESCRSAGAGFHRFQTAWCELRAAIVRDPSQDEKISPGGDGSMRYFGDAEYLLPDLKVFYRYGAGKIVMIALDCRSADSTDR
jgi:hypothetical protein